MQLESHQEEKLRRSLGVIVTETPPGQDWDALTSSEIGSTVDGRRPGQLWIALAAIVVVLVMFSPLVLLNRGGPRATPSEQSASNVDRASTPSGRIGGPEAPPGFPYLTLELPQTKVEHVSDVADEETGALTGIQVVYQQETFRADQPALREIVLRVQKVGLPFGVFDELVGQAEGTEVVQAGNRSVTVYSIPDAAIEEGTYDLAVLHWMESPGFEAILIPWGLDRDSALELMSGVQRVDDDTWAALVDQVGKLVDGSEARTVTTMTMGVPESDSRDSASGEQELAREADYESLYRAAINGDGPTSQPDVVANLGPLVSEELTAQGRVLVSASVSGDVSTKSGEAAFANGSSWISLSWQIWPDTVDSGVLYPDDAKVETMGAVDVITRQDHHSQSSTVSLAVFDGDVLVRVDSGNLELSLDAVRQIALRLHAAFQQATS
jgi:hypothetical protein